MVSRCVQNVINYLNGGSYDDHSLCDDIDIIAKYQLSQIPYEGQQELLRLYNEMLNVRVNEAKSFYDALYTTYPSLILENVAIYHNYPFRQSRNPKADRDLILKLLGYNKPFNSSSEEYIMLVSYLLYLGKVKIDPSFDQKIYDIVLNFGYTTPLDIEHMKHAIYVGRMSDIPFPDSRDAAKKFFDESDTKESTGFYGEYLALDYIKDNLVDGDNVYWVSRYLGDGYGYDILVYNHKQNRYIAYEVKAHILKEEFMKDELTSTEERIKVSSLVEKYNYDYHVIKVLLNRSIAPFQMAHDVALMDDCYYDENGEWVRRVVQNNIINEPNPVNTIKRTKGML